MILEMLDFSEDTIGIAADIAMMSGGWWLIFIF